MILPAFLLLTGGCTDESEDIEPTTTKSLLKEFNLEKVESVNSDNTNWLVFKDESEAKEFLNFVKDDYKKVSEYLKRHPEVSKRSLAYNNNRANKADKEVNSTYDYYPSDPFHGSNQGSFCQTYTPYVNNICVFLQWPSATNGQLNDIRTFISGLELGFTLQHINGSGYKGGDDISFTVTYRIGLGMIYGDVGTFYWYDPETHNGNYKISSRTGNLYQ